MVPDRWMLLLAIGIVPIALLAAPPGDASRILPVAGEWTTATSDGTAVFTHDGRKWSGAAGFPLALFETPASFTSGTVRVQFRLIDGSDDRTAGLVFGYRPRGTYYYVRYNTKDGNVALWRMDGPKRTVIKHGEQHEQLRVGEWHELQLTIDGRRVRAAVNQKLHVDHELEEPPSGQLGLWTKPDATSAFRNLVVSAE
jgi:hypothetical protein